MSKQEKLNLIKEKGQKTKNEIEKEGKKEIRKQLGLGAIEIAATTLPIGKGAQIGGIIGQAALKNTSEEKYRNQSEKVQA